LLALPPLEPVPDGPDDFLCYVAELEAQVAAARQRLEDTDGARTCRYCRGSIPPGDAPGTHEECLPDVLPEGARSCAGCGELIVDDDDQFEHDFCDTPADEAETEPRLGPDLQPSSSTSWPPSIVPEPIAEVCRYTDRVPCRCRRSVEVTFVAPPFAREQPLVSMESVRCVCGVELTVAYSWSRGMLDVRWSPPGASALN
jgi:hypothetical protein